MGSSDIRYGDLSTSVVVVCAAVVVVVVAAFVVVALVVVAPWPESVPLQAASIEHSSITAKIRAIVLLFLFNIFLILHVLNFTYISLSIQQFDLFDAS